MCEREVWVTIGDTSRNTGLNPMPEPVAKRGQPNFLGGTFALGNFRCRGHSGNGGHVFCAWPAHVFVGSPMDDAAYRDARSKKKRTRAGGTMEFVSGQRDSSHPEIVWAERQLSETLDGVAVETNAPLMADCGELLNRLDRPGLIVCVHDGNQHGIPAQGGLEIPGIHAAMAVNFEDAHV